MVQIVSTSARLFAGSLLAGSLLTSVALGAAAATPRIRGAIQAVDGAVLTIKTREGDERKVKMTDNVTVTGICQNDNGRGEAGLLYRRDRACRRPDGTQKAIAIHIFPEAMRGTGEGSRPWDLRPNSSMTNATVDQKVQAPMARR